MIYSIVLPTQRSPRMNVLFVLRKSRTNSLGECPINCRITINGIKAPEFSIGVNVALNKWDSKRQCVKGSSADSIFKNEKLNQVDMKLKAIYLNGIAKNQPYTASEIKAIYDGKKLLVYRIDDLSAKHLELKKGEGVVKGTWKKYERCYRFLREYLGSNLLVSEVTKERVSDFWVYLRTVKGFSSDYCNKIVQACNGMMEYARIKEMCDKNPFVGIKLKWKKKFHKIHYTPTELATIVNCSYSERLQKTVDSLIVMSYTGLHIGDYLKFSPQWIVVRNGVEWIDYSRVKTGIDVMLPLHSEVKKIIKKYGGIENLPRISAQKNNDNLKLVAEKSGIDKHATNKIARKTFCYLVANVYRMSIESLMKMIGHTTTRYLKHYFDIDENRIFAEWPESEKILSEVDKLS